MKNIILRDVGNGLHLLIGNNRIKDLTVDFGGNRKKLHPLYYGHINITKNFLLSHFHADHYNGFSKIPSHYKYHFHIKNFYHPAMPVFSEAQMFDLCLKAMNIRIGHAGAIQTDLFRHVKSINANSIKFESVKKGDIIDTGFQKYEILWPPEVLKEEETIKAISTAINDFNNALEADPLLEKIYTTISKYDANDLSNVDLNLISEELKEPRSNEKKLPIATTKANESLRSAANRLSIVFRQEDNLLFLGDLEKEEIEIIVDDLVKSHSTYYDIIVSAHHGTHWHDKLENLHCHICLASVGKKLRKSIKYEYRKISEKFIRTDEWGDIEVSKKIRIN